MLYSQTDKDTAKKQLTRRLIVLALLALIPNIPAVVLLLTVRIQWLSAALSILGGAAAIFCWGMFCQPIVAYLRYLHEVIGGRSHEFTGELTEIAQDSVREGVACKSATMPAMRSGFATTIRSSIPMAA